MLQNEVKQEGNGPVVRAGRQYTEAVEAVGVKSDFKFKLTDHNYHVPIALWHLVTIHNITANGCLSKMASEAADGLGGHF